MTTCPRCRAELAASSRFCPYCGGALVAGRDEAAPTQAPTPPPPSSHPGSPRFASGVLLAGRYRILDRLGRGGMGEVYRATDLALDHPVALKFLPEALARDPGAVARVHDEVRLARQVSHPNVCRVYDIGEIDGTPYISMEYVDGEDLGTLLRRIGRLPEDKAIEIARKVCAGLAAAHAKGVLHRDLKPGNVMLDAAGQVLIMDFGLAVLASGVSGPDIRSGTPAYMAPEQIEGREVTERSDLFALGAVLYEVVTGHRAFRGAERDDVPAPSEVVKDVDPAFEALILRCLERDPARRPASALQLARALPGGDPLAEALAAGHTPSPAMVAAAEYQGALSVRLATTCLVAALAALVGIVAVGQYASVVQLTGFPDPPQVLSRKARDLAAALGYRREPADTFSEFLVDGEYRGWAERTLAPETYRRQVTEARPSVAYFEYREAQQLLQPRNPGLLVEADDPSIRFGDMVEIRFDPHGRLRFLRGVPLQREGAAAGGPFDFQVLLRAAGLDPAGWTPTDSQYVPPFAYDQRIAWRGTYPGFPDMPMRIEAAAWRGRPTYFIVVGPWSRPIRDEPTPAAPPAQRAARVGGLLLLAVVVTAAAALAWSNDRRGRGDVRGATRLAAFTAVCGFLQWLLDAHHTFTTAELLRLGDGVGLALVGGLVLWVMYLAIEPHVRRRWPQSLIAWTRLLGGDWRDPLVAGHLLIGIVTGLGLALVSGAQDVMGWHLGVLRASIVEANALSGLDRLAARALESLVGALIGGFGFFFLFFLLRVVLRRTWGAALVCVAIVVLLTALPSARPFLAGGFAAAHVVVALAVLWRFGVLPLVVATAVWQVAPLTMLAADPSAWYGGRGLVTGLALLAALVWSFRGALAGRLILSDRLLDR